MVKKRSAKVYQGRSVRAKLRRIQAQVNSGKLNKKRVGDCDLKQVWSEKDRVRRQYEHFGLSYDPNETRNLEKKVDSELLRTYEEKAKNLPPPRARYLSEGEKIYLNALMAKYNFDYSRMSRDLKLNYLQLTERQLEKKCNQLLHEQNGLQ